jgi:glutamate formiminotransferase/formiminotetrahydrofolate cyclodeaminase
LVDEDTDAFNQIMNAFGLPKTTEEEKSARTAAIQEATKNAMLVPYRVIEQAHQAMPLAKLMAEIGNPNSVSDAGVGALALRSAAIGAFLNVKINAGGLNDEDFKSALLSKATQLVEEVKAMESEVLTIVAGKI